MLDFSALLLREGKGLLLRERREREGPTSKGKERRGGRKGNRGRESDGGGSHTSFFTN